MTTCKIVDFAVPAEPKIKLKESEKKDEYLDLVRELKKTMEHESDTYTNRNWCFWYSHQMIIKGTCWTWKLENKWDHPLLRTARILRRVLETWGDLLSFKLQWKTIG